MADVNLTKSATSPPMAGVKTKTSNLTPLKNVKVKGHAAKRVRNPTLTLEDNLSGLYMPKLKKRQSMPPTRLM